MNDSYELRVLTKILNQYLDEMMPITEDGLKKIEASLDTIVWELATKIYSHSGHKVEFTMVRDIITSRIERQRKFLMKQQKVQKLLSQEPREAELSKPTNQYFQSTQKQNVHKEIKDSIFQQKVNLAVGKFGGDEHKARIFIRVQSVICDQLGVDEKEVNLDMHLSKHLGANSYDLLELLIALEEEFEIEISENEQEKLGMGNFDFSWSCSGSGNLDYSRSKECVVRNFVEFISEKTLKDKSS